MSATNNSHCYDETEASDFLTVVKNHSFSWPRSSYASLIAFLEKISPGRSTALLQRVASAYGTDRPVAILDLSASVWAFTTQQSCRACYLSRLSAKGQQLCMSSDHRAASQAYVTKGCGIYRCANLGLLEIVMPIKRFDRNGQGGEVVAVICSGQYASAWHKANATLVCDCPDLEGEIGKALSKVRRLEPDLQGIPLRMAAVSEALKEITNSEGEYCAIENDDILHLKRLLETETTSATSLGRMLHDANSNLENSRLAPLKITVDQLKNETKAQSLTGGTGFRTKDHTGYFFDFFEWGEPSISPFFSWQRWAYPEKKTDLQDQLHPVGLLRKYGNHLEKIRFESCFGYSDWELSQTLWSLEATFPAGMSRFSGNSIRVPFPETNPDISLLTEAQWKDKPNLEVLRRCHAWTAESIKGFQDVSKVPTFDKWQPLRDKLCGLLRDSSMNWKQEIEHLTAPGDPNSQSCRLFSHAQKWVMRQPNIKAQHISALVQSVDWLIRDPETNRESNFFDFFLTRTQPGRA